MGSRSLSTLLQPKSVESDCDRGSYDEFNEQRDTPDSSKPKFFLDETLSPPPNDAPVEIQKNSVSPSKKLKKKTLPKSAESPSTKTSAPATK